ncbi:hypothetical protein NQZ68_013649 [Dissostichus eleginoides]|nr:hypothetical protein NQZ68_013649 [Dissostichus eleginoides]
MTENKLQQMRNRCFVGADMELCAEQVAASAAGRSSERLSMPTFSLQPPPASDRRSSMEDFAVFFYLPIKRHQEIMDLTFSLQPAVEKAVVSQSHSDDAVRRKESLKLSH